MELQETLKEVLANKFVMYFKAQSYHWNVEGIHFSQLHDFFGDIYAEVYASVDSVPIDRPIDNNDDWARKPIVNFALLDNMKIPKKSVFNSYEVIDKK